MKRTLWLWGGTGISFLLLSIVASVSIGAAQLSIGTVWRILLHSLPYAGELVHADWPASSAQIVLHVRLPRIVLGIVVGAALSAAGAGFQGVLRNPLADPFTLGVASGASAGAAFLILTGLQYALFGNWTIPIVAFCSGMATLLAVYMLARVDGRIRNETLILAGVIVQAFVGSAVSFMVSRSEELVNTILFWLMGSLHLRGWGFSGMIAPYAAAGIAVLMLFGRTMNLFELGERNAAHLGVNVERTKWAVLSVATLMTAAAVSVTGVIGFVGLIVPHLVRLTVGPDYRLIVPLSAVAGAIYLVWADTLARTLLSPTEIPIGVITAFLGAPFFAYLLVKHKKSLGGGGGT